MSNTEDTNGIIIENIKIIILFLSLFKMGYFWNDWLRDIVSQINLNINVSNRNVSYQIFKLNWK